MGRPIKDARRHLHVEGKTEEKKAEKKDDSSPSSPPEIDIDAVAALVHRVWMDKGVAVRGESGESVTEGWMVPYRELSEGQREASRQLVKTVLAAVATLLDEEETRP